MLLCVDKRTLHLDRGVETKTRRSDRGARGREDGKQVVREGRGIFRGTLQP
jgi:hypothetical protein